MTPNTFNPTLHGLRGIAALGVVLFHWGQLFSGIRESLPAVTIAGANWSFFTPIDYGWLGVPLFFILSGYLLGGQLKNAPLNVGVLTRFWRRRFLRIYPAVWLQLPILWLAAYAIPNIAPQPEGWALVHNIALWINMPPWMTQPMNGVWWTLPIELSFYLILPLLVLTQRKIGWIATCCGCLLCTLVWRWWIIATHQTSNYVAVLPWLDMIPGSISSFAAGFAITFLSFQWSRTQHYIATIAGLVLLLLLLNLQLSHIDVYWKGHPVLIFWNSLAAAILAFLVYCAISSGRPHWFFGHRLLVWLGEISFGLYLWHFPVQKAIRATDWINWQTPPGSFCALIVTMAITIPLAAASYYWVERPIMGWSKRTGAQR